MLACGRPQLDGDGLAQFPWPCDAWRLTGGDGLLVRPVERLDMTVSTISRADLIAAQPKPPPQAGVRNSELSSRVDPFSGPVNRARDQALAAQPQLVSRRGPVIGIENPRPQRSPTKEAR